VGGRTSTAVTIRNTGSVPVDAWQLSFTLPDRQRLVRGWSGHWRQAGMSVLARGGSLPAGGSVATGFDAAYRDVTSLPAEFLLNGTRCQSVLSVRGQNTPAPPVRAATRSAPKATTAAQPATTDKGADNKGKGNDKGKGKGKD
jgi:hypothetical protein